MAAKYTYHVQCTKALRVNTQEDRYKNLKLQQAIIKVKDKKAGLSITLTTAFVEDDSPEAIASELRTLGGILVLKTADIISQVENTRGGQQKIILKNKSGESTISIGTRCNTAIIGSPKDTAKVIIGCEHWGVKPPREILAPMIKKVIKLYRHLYMAQFRNSGDSARNGLETVWESTSGHKIETTAPPDGYFFRNVDDVYGNTRQAQYLREKRKVDKAFGILVQQCRDSGIGLPQHPDPEGRALGTKFYGKELPEDLASVTQIQRIGQVVAEFED